MKRSIKLICGILLSSLIFASCGNKSIWNTDLEKAEKLAEKKNMDIMLLFSGDDWVQGSSEFKQLLESDEVRQAFSENYIFVNEDFSREELMKIYDADPAKKPSGKIKKIQKKYDEMEDLSRTYNVDDCLCVVFITYEGYVLTKIDDTEFFVTGEDFVGHVNNACLDEMSINKARVNEVRESRGAQKLVAIDNLYNATPAEYQMTLNRFIQEAVEMDPENETGLLGLYEFRNAFILANQNGENGKDVSEPFIEAVNKGHMTPEMEQEAYYNAAYGMALYGSMDLDKMLDLLNKSYEASPSSDNAPIVKKTIDTINSAKEMQEAQKNSSETDLTTETQQ